MTVALSSSEARVLGSLIEKAATTPDNYPLSTNALRLACNQISNRDPVVDYDDRHIDTVMLVLRQRGLARTVHQPGSRVSKHRHVLHEALGLQPDELAVLAILLLRGAQTVAELATRTDRYLGGPGGIDGVEDVISRLSDGLPDDPLIARLARRPGEREPRVVHLFPDADVDGTDHGDGLAPAAPIRGPLDAAPVRRPVETVPAPAPVPGGGFHGLERDPSGESRPVITSAGAPAADRSRVEGGPSPDAGRSADPGPMATASVADDRVVALERRIEVLEAAMARQEARIDGLLAELGG